MEIKIRGQMKPDSWFQLVDHSSEATRYHESWCIVRICSEDGGKTIQPFSYDDIPEGAKCYPYYLLCKPTSRGYDRKSVFTDSVPEEGAVIRGLFGNYKVVHVWQNQAELRYEMFSFAACEADRLRIKQTK